MFAPKIAKPQTKAAKSPISKLTPQHSMFVGHRLGRNPVDQMLSLQRTIGNQAMLRLLAQRTSNLTKNRPGGGHEQEADPANLTSRGATPSVSWDFSKVPVFPPDRTDQSRARPSLTAAPPLAAAIQPKLAVGPANDPLEHEADRVADQVMRMPAPGVSVGAVPTQISRKCASCEEEEKLQKKAAGSDRCEAPAIVHEVLRSPGEPLDAATRAYFEPRFGYDFSQVRVHKNTLAEQSARGVNAHAYTVDQNIVFDAGRFAPRTREGGRLLAHELTHVVQQTLPNRSRWTSTPQLQRKPRRGQGGAREATVEVRWSEDGERFYDRVVAALGSSSGFRGIDPLDFNYASNTESTLHDLVRSFLNQYSIFYHRQPKEGEAVKLRFSAYYDPNDDFPLTNKNISFVEKREVGRGTQQSAAPAAQEASPSCITVPKPNESPAERAQRGGNETACFIAGYLLQADKQNASYANIAISSESTFPNKVEYEGTRERQSSEGPISYSRAFTIAKEQVDLFLVSASHTPSVSEIMFSFGDRAHGPGLHVEKFKTNPLLSKPAPTTTAASMEEEEDECNESDVNYADCLKLQKDENVKEMLKAGEEEAKGWYDPWGLSGGGGGGGIKIPLPGLGRGLKIPKGGPAGVLTKLEKLQKVDKSSSMAMKELAGGIHGITGRLKGQAIAVVEVQVGTEIRYAAATSSGAGWRPWQTKILKGLGIERIPPHLSEVVHAEGNVRAWVDKLEKTTGKKVQVRRWGMSAGYSGKYICQACRQIAKQMGGIIEEF